MIRVYSMDPDGSNREFLGEYETRREVDAALDGRWGSFSIEPDDAEPLTAREIYEFTVAIGRGL